MFLFYCISKLQNMHIYSVVLHFHWFVLFLYFTVKRDKIKTKKLQQQKSKKRINGVDKFVL